MVLHSCFTGVHQLAVELASFFKRNWMKVMGIHARMLSHRNNLGDYSNSNVFAKHVSLGNIFWN